jgi:hypothetical protein
MSEPVKAAEVNCEPWSVLKISGLPNFCPEGLVKRAWIWFSAKARVAVGNGGRSALSVAP